MLGGKFLKKWQVFEKEFAKTTFGLALAEDPELRRKTMIEFPRTGLCVNRLKEERFRTQYLGVILKPVRNFFGDLMRISTPFTVADVMEIYDSVSEARSLNIGALNPGAFVKHLERAMASETVSDIERAKFIAHAERDIDPNHPHRSDPQTKAARKLLYMMSENVPLTLDMEKTSEGLKMFVEPLLKEPEDIQLKWAHVLKVAESARGTKPTKKLTTSMRAAIQDLGEVPFKRGLIDFAHNLTDMMISKSTASFTVKTEQSENIIIG